MTEQDQEGIITAENSSNRQKAIGPREPLEAVLKKTILSYNLRKNYFGFTCFLFQVNNGVSECYLYFLFLTKLNLYLCFLVAIMMKKFNTLNTLECLF